MAQAQASLLLFPDLTTNCAPAASRIRDRGAASLTDEELFAYLIGPNAAALMASEPWTRWIRASHGVLRAKGLGDEEAVRFRAAIEVARRIARSKLETPRLLSRPDLVADYLVLRYARGEQEVMGALFLDIRRRRIADEIFFRGALARAHVDPKPVLRRALELNAASFVLFHTHPSGDPAPSSEDLAFTRQITAAAEALGLEMHDHLILGSANRWVSLRRHGGW